MADILIGNHHLGRQPISRSDGEMTVINWRDELFIRGIARLSAHGKYVNAELVI